MYFSLSFWHIFSSSKSVMFSFHEPLPQRGAWGRVRPTFRREWSEKKTGMISAEVTPSDESVNKKSIRDLVGELELVQV